MLRGKKEVKILINYFPRTNKGATDGRLNYLDWKKELSIYLV